MCVGPRGEGGAGRRRLVVTSGGPRERDPASADDAEDVRLLAAWADDGRPRGEREAAFRSLVDRYQHRVFAICARELGSRHDAEEATQDTFAKLARAADDFRGDSRVSTFVYRIAVNACRDLQRYHGRRPSTPVDDLEPALARRVDGADEVADVAIGVELSAALQAALDDLDELSRTLVLLCSVQGLTYPEASEVLDVPVGTIKSRIFRARARLAESLAGERSRP